MDLSRARLAAAVVRPAWPQRLVQAGLLFGYGALVVLGWGRDAIPGIPDLHPRMYTHVTPLLVWVVGLMGLVLVVPAAGRAWCGVCPLGAATDWLGRRGLGLGWPRWVRSGAGAVVAFATGVGAVVWGDVHQSPHGTAVVLAVAAGVAVASALVWRRSAFCRGVCPVGGVLHLYARHGPVEIRPADPARCAACSGHGCVATQGQWRRWDVGRWVVHRRTARAGCPVALYPPRMDPAACLLCLRCVRSCPDGNLGVYWGRKPATRPLDPARAAVLAAVTGLVAFALLRTWPDARIGLTPGVLPPPWWSAVWLGVGLPAALLGIPWVVGRAVAALAGRRAPPPPDGASPGPAGPRLAAERGRKALAYLAAFVGPVLGGHAALAVVKLNAKAGYLPYLVYDPLGAETYVAIHVAGLLPLPDLLVPLAVLRWLAVAVLVVGCWAGGRELWRLLGARGGETGPAVVSGLYAASWLGLVALLGAALVHWLFGG